MVFIPLWFRELYVSEGRVCADESRIIGDYLTYQDYRAEGHSRDYILVRVLGLRDPSE